MRERLTYKILLARCAGMYHRAQREGKPVNNLNISYDEFMDLKMDKDFADCFAWRNISEPLKEFQCHGIRCVIN